MTLEKVQTTRVCQLAFRRKSRFRCRLFSDQLNSKPKQSTEKYQLIDLCLNCAFAAVFVSRRSIEAVLIKELDCLSSESLWSFTTKTNSARELPIMLRLMCGWDSDTSWSLWCFVSWVRRKNWFEFVVTFVCDASTGFASPIRNRKLVVFSSLSSISIWNMSPLLFGVFVQSFCPHNAMFIYEIFCCPYPVSRMSDDSDGKACKTNHESKEKANETFFPDVWRSFSSDAIEACEQWENFFSSKFAAACQSHLRFKQGIIIENS